MMRFMRFSIAGLMGAVLIVALGLAALRSASATWSSATFLATCGLLCLALVGAVCRGEAERAWWLGFALFGWGYLALAFWSRNDSPKLSMLALLETVCTMIGVNAPYFGFGPLFPGVVDPSYAQVGHSLWSLLFAVLGGVLASALFAVPALRSERVALEVPPAGRPPRMWWLRPAGIGLGGLGLLSLVALTGSKWSLGLWAGATFLVTWGLLGIAALGAVFSRGRPRQVWAGAALFGVGYMILAFGRYPDQETWAYLVTDHFLNGLRPGLPPIVSVFPDTSDSTAAANARIMKALEQRLPMKFPNGTPLQNLLSYVRDATRGPDGKGIPIYVDPLGMGEAQAHRDLTYSASIDLEDVALRTSLRLYLKQFDLAYHVRDGVLIIGSSGEDLSVFEDPFMIIGHCLLALIVAGFGGSVAPLVSQKREST
jgi:hypothetical protein